MIEHGLVTDNSFVSCLYTEVMTSIQSSLGQRFSTFFYLRHPFRNDKASRLPNPEYIVVQSRVQSQRICFPPILHNIHIGERNVSLGAEASFSNIYFLVLFLRRSETSKQKNI